MKVRAILGAIVLWSIATATMAAVGRTPGQFQVSATGAANYRVPLWMPPGALGMQPNLALDYNSETGNGVMGVGWALAGLSSIERCNRTVAQDGVATAVELSTNDRFCLNGNKLRLVSGSYGAASSTYRQEIHDYSTIVAAGAVGTGPERFTVKTKDGTTLEYGGSVDSRVILGSSVFRWKLNKATDASGNSYVVTYNNVDGHAYPTAVDWAATAPGGSTYIHRATFNYSTGRTGNDSIYGYVAGHQVSVTQRLDDIQIRSTVAGVPQTVRRYFFTYDTSVVTQRSRLTQIKECADDAAADCLSPTLIAYQAGQNGVSGTVAVGPSSSTSIRKGDYDFNGDQRHDLMYVTGGFWHVAFATTGGFSAPISTGIVSTTRPLVERFVTGVDTILGDVGGNWSHYRWNGASFTVTPTGTSVGSVAKASAADTNGDGFVDLVWVDGQNNVWIRLNTSTSASLDPSFASTATHASTIFPWVGQTSAGTVLSQSLNTSGVRRSDFDGDGRQDVYHTFPTIGGGLANRVLFARNTTLDGGAATLFTPGDATAINMNDDACTDFVASDLIQIMPCANAAAALVTVPSVPILVLDWDGDGRTDFAVNNGGNFGIYKSTGLGLSAIEATSIPYSTGFTYFSVDQDGDTLADIVRVATTSPFDISFFTHTSSGSAPPFATNVPDVATSFTDGYGVNHSIGYVSTARSNYTRGTGTIPSLSHMVRAIVVVGQVTSTDGTGTTFNRSYSYTAGRVDDDRRTFAGFEQRTETDARNNLIRKDTYEQLFPLVGYPTKNELLQSNGTTLISETTNTYQSVTGGGTYAEWAFPFLRTSVARRREMGGTYNGVLLSTTTTTNTVDAASGAFSEIETVVVEESGGNGLYGGQSHTTTKTITPYNDVTNNCLGKSASIVEERSHTGPMGTLETQTTNFTWDGLRCRLDTQVIEPGSTKWQVTIDYDYDAFGNVNQETVTPASGQGQTARVTTFDWGTSGQFLHSVTNALSQTTSFQWNLRTGYLEGVTEQANSSPAVVRTTTLTPDTFGRLSVLLRPDGTSTNYTRTACSAGNSYCTIGASDLRYSLTAESRSTLASTLRTEVQYFDGFDRLRTRDTQLFGSLNSRVARTYNSLGLLATQSTPHTPADPVWQTTYFYDALGRMSRARRWKHEGDSSNHDTDYSYDGLRTGVTNARGYSTYEVRTAWGDLVRVTDAASNNTDYQYHPFGYLRKTIDAESNETLLTYTNRGLKLTSADPDMGSWSYDYFPLGEIKSHTNALSQTTYFTHDALSRLLTRVETEGTTSFVWDSATNGIGQLASASSPAYSESYGYELSGRRTQMNITADGVTYTYDYAYDTTTGLLDTMTYPTSSPGYRLKLRYTYDTGLLKSIYDYTGNVVGPTLWQAHALNARGQIIYESQENGHYTSYGFDRITGWLDDRTMGPNGGTTIQNFSYLWDEAGNLTRRVDSKNGTTETFLYDSRDRMYESSRNGSVVLSVGYDALGNIETKTGIGTYSYTGASKHAVTGTTSGGSYSYDANGNMTSRNGNTITWYSNNKPRVINGSGFSSEFWYGPTGERWKQRTVTGSTVGIRRYIGPFMERLDTPATNEFRHYIYAPTGPVAMYKRPLSGLSPVWSHLVADYLGSTDVIMNGAGSQLADMSFTPFGERKAADGISSLTAAQVTAYRNVTNRGFTSHEHLDQLELIHMNGRVYDPALGRFISADPYVQAPYNAQSLNRYSYAFNNPLSYIDPSGFACGTITEIIDGAPHTVPQICPYPDQPFFPGYDIGGGGVPGGGGGGGGAGTGNTGDSTAGDDQEKCWNGEEGNIGDFVSGLARQVGNDLSVLGAQLQSLQYPLNPLNELNEALAPHTFGSNNTNMGIFGADLAPAAEILGTGGAGALRYAGLRGGTQGAREFLGLVGNRSIQMDHVFIQRAAGGNTYWNLFPTSAQLNRLMGQANNWTLSNQAIMQGALARFIQNGKLGATAGGSLAAGDVIGAAIAANSGCN